MEQQDGVDADIKPTLVKEAGDGARGVGGSPRTAASSCSDGMIVKLPWHDGFCVSNGLLERTEVFYGGYRSEAQSLHLLN